MSGSYKSAYEGESCVPTAYCRGNPLWILYSVSGISKHTSGGIEYRNVSFCETPSVWGASVDYRYLPLVYCGDIGEKAAIMETDFARVLPSRSSICTGPL
jgi:hypothetical protein